MKLVINSTDFSTIGTALYFSGFGSDTKFLPSWVIVREKPSDDLGFEYLGELGMANDLENPLKYENGYFSIDNGRYYAYPSPELFNGGTGTTGTPLGRDSIHYLGNNERILDRDFAEYDFSYLVDKYKFNDDLKIQYLDNASQNLLGYDPAELTTIEKIMFPSAYDNQNTSGINSRNYFGTATIGSYTLFLFKVPADVRKVELYEGSIIDPADISVVGTNYDYRVRNYNKYNPNSTYSTNDMVVHDQCMWRAKNNNITGEWDEGKWRYISKFIQPCLSIYLGPDYLWSQCPNSWYQVDPESWGVDIRYIPTSKKYLHGLDEISSEKILWMVITESGELVDINLSYHSWKTDEVNPERRKWEYALRNDEYWSTKDNLSILDKRSKIILDGRSNTILSTDEVNQNLQPILKRKLKRLGLLQYKSSETYKKGDKVRHQGKLWIAKIDNITGVWNEDNWEECIEDYSPFCTYRLGERVYYGSTVYESLCDLNLGNRPDISSEWELAENTTNFLTNRINVVVSPSNAGRIIPGGQLRISENDGYKYFTIYENLGFSLDSNNPCSSKTGVPLLGVSILESDIQVEGGTMRKKMVRISPTSFETLVKSGNLIFNFNPVSSKIKLFSNYKGSIQAYSTSGTGWTYNSENIILKMTPVGNVSEITDVVAGTKITLSAVNASGNPITNNKIVRAVSKYTDKFGVTRTKDLVVSDNKITDIVDFSIAEYTLYIGENSVMIDCEVGLELFEMNDNRIELPYNGTGVFKFYPRTTTGRYLKVYVGESSSSRFKDDSTISSSGLNISNTGVCSSCKVYSDGTTADGRHKYKVEFTGLTGTATLKLIYE